MPPRQQEDSLAADMSDAALARGLEDALDIDGADDEREQPARAAAEPVVDDALDEDVEGAGKFGDTPEGDDEDGGDALEPMRQAMTGEPAKPAEVEAKPTDTPEGEPIVREDGAVWNAKAGTTGRWQKDGQFVEGEPPAEQPAADAAIAWEPFSVTVDKESVTIPEAQVSRRDGHTFLAIPDDKLPDFQRRMSRAHVAERKWRDLDAGLKAVEAEREALANRPPVRSDSEVEVDVMLEALKPMMADLFTAEQLENLELRVKLAQREEKEKVGQYETERATQSSKQQEAEQQAAAEVEEFGDTVRSIVTAELPAELKAKLDGLTPADVDAVVAALVPIRAALIDEDDEGRYVNTQYVFDRLAERAALTRATRASSTSATTAAPAPSTTATTPAPAGTTVTATRAERFNRGQDTAARPTTTSLKAGRTDASRPPERGTTGSPRRPAAPLPAAMAAEDEFTATLRDYTRSPGLDF